LLGVTAVSLMNVILAIWKVYDGQMMIDIYQAAFFALVASGIIRMLLKANQIDKVTRLLSMITVGVTVATYILILPWIFVNFPDILPELYQRIMWATIILLVTLSVLTYIFNRLFLNQHPEFDATKHTPKGKIPTWVKVVIFIICLPIAISILSWLTSLLFYGTRYHI
jgi:hypothetical protein